MEPVTDLRITLRARLASTHQDAGARAQLVALGFDPDATSWGVTPSQLEQIALTFGLDVHLGDLLAFFEYFGVSIRGREPIDIEAALRQADAEDVATLFEQAG